jgi:hypothetical protein
LDAKYRRGISGTGQVKSFDAGVFVFDARKSILKNRLYWYNGIELVVQRAQFSTNSQSLTKTFGREFVKTGLTFEF